MSASSIVAWASRNRSKDEIERFLQEIVPPPGLVEAAVRLDKPLGLAYQTLLSVAVDPFISTPGELCMVGNPVRRQ